jgi:signal transduction histidine kinase/CheY-like chemotaxis protein
VASPGANQLSPIQEALNNKRYQYFALGFAAIVWLIFVQSAIRQVHIDWQIYLIGARISMVFGAVFCVFIVSKSDYRNVASVYFLVCMLLQSSFACLEAPTKTDFYKYVPMLMLLQCLTYSGFLRNWLVWCSPWAAVSIMVPLFFKDNSFFISVGSFAFAFTESVAVTAIAIVFLKVSTDKFQALRGRLELQLEIARLKAEESDGFARKLAAARLEIERGEKDRALGKIVRMISHDVRKPFSILKVLMEGIKSAKSESEIRNFTASALPELQQSIDSVDGLLQDVMQVGAENVELVREPVSVESLVDSVLAETFRGHVNADITIDYKTLGAEALEVDVHKVKRIFGNIISNACQAIGWVGHIWIHAERRESRVFFTLGNAGSFIPDENLPNLFDAFYTSNKRGGTGLGLAIARTWSEAHGGSISCRSEKSPRYPEGFVEFLFDLPAAAEFDGLARPFIHSHSSAYRLKILLPESGVAAESREAFLRPIREHILHLGNTIRMAAIDDENSYLKGIELAVEELGIGSKVELSIVTHTIGRDLPVADLYLVDFDLGDVNQNGLDLIRLLRARNGRSFICLHTNRSDAETFRNAMQAGADAVYAKPLPLEHLAKLIFEASKRLGPTSGCVASRSGAHSSNGMHVAFADDSLVMRLSWKRALADRLNLCLFASPEELFRSNQQFDVVVTDMNFDNSTLSGVDVAHWSRSAFPGARVFLCSNEPMMADGLFDGRLCKERVPTLQELS